MKRPAALVHDQRFHQRGACAHGHGGDDMTCSWVRFSSSRFLDKLDHHFRPFGYIQFFDARIDLS